MKNWIALFCLVGLLPALSHAQRPPKPGEIGELPELPKLQAPVAAEACPVGMNETIEAVLKLPSCPAAAMKARECAWGSSADSHIAGAAIRVCEKDFSKRMTTEEKKAYENLRKKCEDKYSKLQGTMYIAMMAHCKLGVAETYSDVFSPAEEE